jgi:hypothetical protein
VFRWPDLSRFGRKEEGHESHQQAEALKLSPQCRYYPGFSDLGIGGDGETAAILACFVDSGFRLPRNLIRITGEPNQNACVEENQ